MNNKFKKESDLNLEKQERIQKALKKMRKKTLKTIKKLNAVSDQMISKYSNFDK